MLLVLPFVSAVFLLSLILSTEFLDEFYAVEDLPFLLISLTVPVVLIVELLEAPFDYPLELCFVIYNECLTDWYYGVEWKPPMLSNSLTIWMLLMDIYFFLTSDYYGEYPLIALRLMEVLVDWFELDSLTELEVVFLWEFDSFGTYKESLLAVLGLFVFCVESLCGSLLLLSSDTNSVVDLSFFIDPLYSEFWVAYSLFFKDYCYGVYENLVPTCLFNRFSYDLLF